MKAVETTELVARLEQLQKRLCEMANDIRNLTDPEILAVSEEADRLIVQLQRLRKEESNIRKQNGVFAVSAALSAAKSPEEVGKQR